MTFSLRLPETARVVFGRTELSQPEMLQRAACIARQLADEWGVQPGDRVGLMLSAGTEVIPAILGIWKAGAAYVPVDPLLPDERIYQIASDAGLKGFLTQSAHRITLDLLATRLGMPIPRLEVDQIAFDTTEAVCAEFNAPLDRAAYLIYTSGSTGRPKGVVCTFRGLLNLIAAVREPLSLSRDTRHLQFASLSFDASVWECFPTLFAGGTLVQATREDLLPGKRMAELLREQRITHLCLPPSVLGKLSGYASTLTDLRCLVMAGERCPPALAKQWRFHCRVINAYGPTETTVCATLHEVQEDESPVPIGRALCGVQVRIVDEKGRNCPPGTPGELWIGGEGVSAGYFGQPELTQRSFPQDGEGRAWYRSGDEVVQRSDGRLIFLGRVDQQVKLRGFRIEIEAIEQALYAIPGVAQAAAKVFEHVDALGISSGILVAYYNSAEGRLVTHEALRVHLSLVLPDYMVPHHFVELPQLPLMPNHSKVDRAALEAPEEWRIACDGERGQEPRLDQDPLARLCCYFEEAMEAGVGSVAADTHFFHGGGDSLGVAQLLLQIEEDFGVALPPHLVYSHPTPAALLPFCLQEISPADQTMDHVREGLLRDAICQLSALDGIPRVATLPKRILLTGGTGFLGIHLLAALAPRVDRLYCLVRSTDDAAALSRLRATAVRYSVCVDWNERIQAVTGDIELKALGLSPERYRELALDCDAIVHAAASISYILPYSEAGTPNVLGTRHILALATAERVKPLHHVSSMSVYGASYSLLGLPEVTEDFDIDRSLEVIGHENGYTRAKWVAEKTLRCAAAEGVPVSIYRPGFIQGDSQHGIGNPDDLLCRYIVGNIQMGRYPDFPNKYWLPVPVDYVAQAVTHIICSQPPGGAYNLLPERSREPSNNELFEMLTRMGYGLERVTPNRWLQELNRLTPDNALFPLVGFLREKVYQNRRTVLEIHHSTSQVRCDRTIAALRGSGLRCPELDVELLAKYLDYLFKGRYAGGILSTVDSGIESAFQKAVVV